MEAFVSQLANGKILRVCSNAIEAFEALQNQQIDVIFLDIKMPVVSGIDFLKSLKNPLLVVFTTAYNKYAMEGYELNVVDYLLKPIAMHRLIQAAEKVNERLMQKSAALPDQNRADITYIFVKHENKLVKIDFDQIQYVEAMQNFVNIHTAGKSFLVTQTMKNLEEILPPVLSARIHKSYIVSMHAITSVYVNTIEIGEVKISIGSNYKNAFMEKIA